MFKSSLNCVSGQGDGHMLSWSVLSKPPLPATRVRIRRPVASGIFDWSMKSEDLKIGVQKKEIESTNRLWRFRLVHDPLFLRMV